MNKGKVLTPKKRKGLSMQATVSYTSRAVRLHQSRVQSAPKARACLSTPPSTMMSINFPHDEVYIANLNITLASPGLESIALRYRHSSLIGKRRTRASTIRHFPPGPPLPCHFSSFLRLRRVLLFHVPPSSIIATCDSAALHELRGARFLPDVPPGTNPAASRLP